MNGVLETSWQTLDDYLKHEKHSPVRREYWGGCVFPTDMESSKHEIILQNLFLVLQQKLAGSQSQIFAAEMKLRLPVGNQELFYYPDLMVTSEQCDFTHPYCSHPKLLIEVTSPKTKQIDNRSKLLFSRHIPTLQEFILVDETRHEVTVHQRVNKWLPETFNQTTPIFSIPSIGISLDIAAIYNGSPNY